MARVCAGHDLAPAVITFGGVVKGGSSGRMVLLSTVFASKTRIAPAFRALDLLVPTHIVVLCQLAVRHLLPAVRPRPSTRVQFEFEIE